jgi:hypothetical protein
MAAKEKRMSRASFLIALLVALGWTLQAPRWAQACPS